MTKKEAQLIKKKILKCLTEDFTYGKTKKGLPLKRPKVNQAIFDYKEGWQCFNGTDLKMVMESVVLGIYFAMDEINKGE